MINTTDSSALLKRPFSQIFYEFSAFHDVGNSCSKQSSVCIDHDLIAEFDL